MTIALKVKGAMLYSPSQDLTWSQEHLKSIRHHKMQYITQT